MEASVVVAIVAACATIIVGMLTYRAGQRANNLSQDGNQLQWVKEIRDDAAEARKEIRAVRSEAATLANELHTVVQWIWQPDMTMERLRAQVAERERLRAVGRSTDTTT